MRAGSVLGTAYLVGALCACAAGSAPAAQRGPTATTPAVSAAAASPVQRLAARIPAGALRCVTSTTLPLDDEQRALMTLVSQTQTLPWGANMVVEAYARARVRTLSGYQTLVWIQFAPGQGGPERIRAAVDGALGTSIRWADASPGCDNPVDCGDTVATFESPRRVRLVTGGGQRSPGSADNVCAQLVREFPTALEVASWNHDSGFAGEMGLLRTDQVLRRRGEGLTKMRRRHYSDDQHQVAAYQEELFGMDELPLIAGLPVEPYREIRGRALVEHSDVLWDDLRLVVEDHVRQQRVRGSNRGPSALSEESLSALRDQARWMLAGLENKVPSERRDATRLLVHWLTRVRKLHPRDGALAGVQYRVFLEELGDARSALSVTEEMLRLGSGDPRHWRLNQRRALSHLGANELAPVLAEAHGLSADEAARMASEIIEAVARGDAFERAEWGWLTARELALSAGSAARVRIDPQTFSLATLPRTVAYLAARSPSLRGTYGVHVLARGRLASKVAPQGDGAWSAISRGGGQEAWVGAASALDDAQLGELGRILSDQLLDGPVQLLVSVRPVGGSPNEAAHLLFLGTLDGGRLTVERTDPRTASLDWPRIRRLLAEPLTRLTSQGFPSDELRVPADDPAMAAQMVAWGESEAGVSCQHVELWVVCRGPMHDVGAALRTLLRIGDRVLSEQSLRLWGRSPE